MTAKELLSSLLTGLDNALPSGWGKWAAGGTIVLALAYLAFVPTAVPVDTAIIDRGPLEVTVTAEGRTRIRDIFTVSAPLTGRVLRITLDPGDPVVGGETTVAIFEPAQPGFLNQRRQAQAQAVLANTKATVIRARAEHDFAKTEYRRVSTLDVGRTVTQTDVDLKKSLYDAAKASLDAAVATQAAARAALISPTTRTGGESRNVDECCLRLIAPIDGEVLRVLQESERVMLAVAPGLTLTASCDNRSTTISKALG